MTMFLGVILDQDQNRIGLATLISEDMVVTAAHVVNQALGRTSDSDERPAPTAIVRLNFPNSGHDRKGNVKRWIGPGQLDGVSDICVLQLTTPLPESVKTARLISTPAGLRFRAGYFSGPKSPMNLAYGRIMDDAGGGYKQVIADNDHPFLRPGTSGGPAILDKDEAENSGDYVIGLVARANLEENTGHIITTNALAEAFSEIKLVNTESKNRPEEARLENNENWPNMPVFRLTETVRNTIRQGTARFHSMIVVATAVLASVLIASHIAAQQTKRIDGLKCRQFHQQGVSLATATIALHEREVQAAHKAGASILHFRILLERFKDEVQLRNPSSNLEGLNQELDRLLTNAEGDRNDAQRSIVEAQRNLSTSKEKLDQCDD